MSPLALTRTSITNWRSLILPPVRLDDRDDTPRFSWYWRGSRWSLSVSRERR